MIGLFANFWNGRKNNCSGGRPVSQFFGGKRPGIELPAVRIIWLRLEESVRLQVEHIRIRPSHFK